MLIKVGIIAGFSPRKAQKFDPELARELGFYDENESGAIDKPIWENLWQANEGYDPIIDLNRDGKILEAEAKYYLQNLENVNFEVKRKYALKDDEKFLIFSYRLDNIKKIRDPFKKALELRGVALEILEAGFTPGRQARLFNLIMEIVPAITHPRMQGMTLRFLVSKIVEADLNSDERELLLNKAMEIASAFKDEREKNKTLTHIAKVIIEIGSSIQWLKIFPLFDIF
jgi:hypothetical protein